jgi:AcrR family transcriptional regulator
MNASMRPSPVGVKRRYDGSRRREAADRKRAQVLDAAMTLFEGHGYAATTVQQVASEAGVSVETIYKKFGGKAGLVRALFHRGLAGAGSTPAEVRSDSMSAAEQSARNVLRGWADLTAEVSPRGSPIVLLIHAAAATDPEARALVDEMNTQRLERMTHNAKRLRGKAGLRRELSTAEIRDVLFTYSASELYDILVLHRGWSLRRFSDFVFAGMCAQLLDHP